MGTISKKGTTQLLKEHKKVISERNQLLDCLNRRLAERNEIYGHLVKAELKILNQIKELLTKPEIRRAYESNEEHKEIIEEIICDISSGCMEVTNSKSELMRRLQQLINIEEKRKEFEENKLNKIRDEVGNSIWEDFNEHFKKHEFLKQL